MSDVELMKRIVQIKSTGTHAALATVIRTKGSTPRKVGAKMIIYGDGTIAGTIGGGCGEGEVIEAAMHVIATKMCTHHKVDLTAGLFYEDGGICGGIQYVFIEPI
ncbi:sulfurylase small subunit [Paenibacillus sp. Soil766]|uniref:XdhC family protein n=1 Tax=Paenibacillus sp. Soil766 TaxID=1736404 RepID=UPI00070C2056|nr:XdhC family protein [Paenibacillus sp. Soil766]KRE99393.1 sulfurylase small subunit [Paenibacillus sp. Soil766]